MSHFLGVAGEHDRLFHTHSLQLDDGLLGVGLGLIRDHDMPGVEAVDGHMDDGAGQLTGQPVDALALHQTAVAHADALAVHLRHDTVSGDLLHVGDPAAVHSAFAGLPQRDGNGVRGILLRQSRVFQHLIRFKARLRMDGGYGKGALRQGAGLVEHHGVRLGQRFQIVAALDQNTALGGAADAAEKAQRYGDHQRAGAGDDQEGQGPVEPVRPDGAHQKSGKGGQHRQQDRRDQEQGQRRIHHTGGIVFGKPGDKLLADGFLFAGILHQLQNFGNRGFLTGLCHRHPQQPRQVHAAADDVIAHTDASGQGFAGEGGGIQCGTAL